MKETKQVFQIATIFVGSIVGAGLSSGRELSQFFSVYGPISLLGLVLCGLSYIYVGKMILEITLRYQVKSYDAFIELVCPKWIAKFTNLFLTLFLVSSTSIIFAGSSSIVHQYFGIPKWIGLLGMLGVSLCFLLRETEGLFEVNSFVVPLLILVMSSIFIGFLLKSDRGGLVSALNRPFPKEHWIFSSLIYSGFNIISIIGILVPLSHTIGQKGILQRGIQLGTLILTLISSFIVILMMLNPVYPQKYDIPILAVAGLITPLLQVFLLVVIWLEMLSSQVSNIFSLTKCLENRYDLSYKKGIWIILLAAVPFSLVGFSRLVDYLYPLYGMMSLFFVTSLICFYFRLKVTICKKGKQVARS